MRTKKAASQYPSDDDVCGALLTMAKTAAETATQRIESGDFNADEVHILCTAAASAYNAARLSGGVLR